MSILTKSYNEVGNYGFQYRDLEKITPLWRHDFLTQYVYDLQDHAQQLEHELIETREARSKDGNRFYQQDAKQALQDVRELRKTIFTQDRQLLAKQAEIDKLKQQLKELQAGIEVVPTRTVNADHHEEWNRRDSKGRFKTGNVPKEIKEKQCYLMLEQNGMTPDEVAEEIGGLSASSVVTYKNNYLSRMRKAQEAERAAQSERDRQQAQEKAQAAYLEQFGIYVSSY